jgi:hypothetical protein
VSARPGRKRPAAARAGFCGGKGGLLRLRYRPGRPLTLIRPGDAGFASALDASFPGFSARPDYQSWLPWLVLLENGTNRYARAYAITWRITEPQGGYAWSSASWLTTPFEMGRPQLDKAINPGLTRLVSPFFNLSERAWAQHAADPAGWQAPMPAGRLPPPGSGVEAELDGVVYGNGSFYGPNQTDILGRYLVARTAEHDEALSLLRLIDSGAPGSKLGIVLERRRLRARFDQGHGPNAMYVRARARAAVWFTWLLGLPNGGVRALRSAVQQLVQEGPPYAHRSSLGRWYRRRFRDHDLGPHAKRRGLEPYLFLTKE